MPDVIKKNINLHVVIFKEEIENMSWTVKMASIP